MSKDNHKLQTVEYRKFYSEELWWCNSHQRKAEYLQWKMLGPYIVKEEHCCDPKLGGPPTSSASLESGRIMLPCRCVNLTGMVEIEDENKT